MVYDTNVLIYAVDDRSEFHDACLRRIESVRTGYASGFLTWSICYEFLRVTSHARVLSNPWNLSDGVRFLSRLLESPGFYLLRHTELHLPILYQVAAELPDIRGNRVHDLHTAVLMREHGITQICTMDGDFRRFPFVEVVDPRQ